MGPLLLLTISRIAFPDLPAETQRRVRRHARAMDARLIWRAAPDAGYLETVLDAMLQEVRDQYAPSATSPSVLRLDDDEWASPPLQLWLRDRAYRTAPHWSFPRMHRWADGRTWLKVEPLYPDYQTRLSRIDLAGGRGVIHGASPAGFGALCAHPIIHDKLLKPEAERAQIAAGYDRVMDGAGTGAVFLPLNLPERHFSAAVLAAAAEPFPYGDPT